MAQHDAAPTASTPAARRRITRPPSATSSTPRAATYTVLFTPTHHRCHTALHWHLRLIALEEELERLKLELRLLDLQAALDDTAPDPMVWGCHRDSAQLLEVGLPVFSLGARPNGPLGVEPAPPDAIPCLGEHRVEPGDLVVGDADGVLLLPGDQAEEIVRAAAEIARTEAGQAAAVRAGRSLREQLEFGAYLERRGGTRATRSASTSAGGRCRRAIGEPARSRRRRGHSSANPESVPTRLRCLICGRSGRLARETEAREGSPISDPMWRRSARFALVRSCPRERWWPSDLLK